MKVISKPALDAKYQEIGLIKAKRQVKRIEEENNERR